MTRLRLLAPLVLLAASLTLTVTERAAHADDPAAVATAEALFAEARTLVAAGNLSAACPKFEAAQRLAPTPGTLLNLASCYEKSGRTASAWASYRDAISMSRAAGRVDLVESAQKRAAALEPKLARLAITVTSTAPGLTVMRDSVAVPREGWATPVPVDPGEHVVVASAEGRKPFRVTVPAPAEGATSTINVPELEVDPSAASPAPAPGPGPGTATSTAPATAPSAPAVMAPDGPRPGSTQRTLGLVAGGVGVVGFVLTGVFAAQATSRFSDSKAKCNPDAPNLCSPEGKSLRDDARSAGDIATVSFIAGALFAGAGAALYFTAPRGDAPRAAGPLTVRRLALDAGPTPLGVGLTGVIE